MNLGSRFDVNNSINFASAYPGGRSSGYAPPSANRYRNRNNFVGELGAVNVDSAMQIPSEAQSKVTGSSPNGTMANGAMMTGGMLGKPTNWWLGFVVVFALFVFASRRFNGGEKFTNIKMSVYNGIFLTIFIVLILNLLKVFAARFPIPGLSPLILAA